MVGRVRSKPAAFGDVFELRVTLRELDPPVWRSLRVPADMPLSALHEVLQIAFGWQNSHLHEFRAGDIRFGIPDVEDQFFSVDERAAPIGAVARIGSQLVYHYDFGDDWEHDLVVERVDGANGPSVARAERAPARRKIAVGPWATCTCSTCSRTLITRSTPK